MLDIKKYLSVAILFEVAGLLDSTFSCFQLLKRMSRDAGNVCYKVTRT